MKTHKILIVEKDLLARQAITKVLKKEGSYRIVATSNLGRNVETTIREKNPDVVLFNLEDIKSGEFEVFTKLRVRFPKLPVVVVSPRSEKGGKAAITALSMGAVDVLTKPNRCNNLLFANRIVYNLIATFGLVPIIWLLSKMNYDSIFEITALTRYISLMLATFGVILINVAMRQYDLKEFLGLKSSEENATLEVGGLLSYVRHPIYSGVILLTCGYFLFTPTIISLVTGLCILVYLIVGIRLEEKKLIEEFGDEYLEYRDQVPAIFPKIFK